MTRPPPIPITFALLALAALASPAAARPAAVISPYGPPQPSPTAPQLPASPGAGWSCGRERCAYVKTSGQAWSGCFTGWSPSHRSWRPTRYCH